jgi:hypothetical protein
VNLAKDLMGTITQGSAIKFLITAGLELLHIPSNILQHFKEDTLRMLGLAIINAGFLYCSARY